MAFIFTEGFPQIVVDGSSTLAVIDIGFDDHTRADYKAIAAFEPLPGGHGHEFVFYILEVEAGKEPYPYWSGKDTTFIKGARRVLVRDAFETATRALIEAVKPKPKMVDRVTYDVHPPEVSLEKHRYIQEIFESYGYRLTESDVRYGNIFWRMELS